MSRSLFPRLWSCSDGNRALRRQPAAHRLAAEPLENRLLPSATLLDLLPGGGASAPERLTDVNGTLFFTASTPETGRELWKSDGTAAGTALVKDMRPGSLDSHLYAPTNVNGTLFFVADSSLWKSDGTTAGTVLIRGLGSGYDYPEMVHANGTLFVSDSDSLWTSDGTSAGTVRVWGPCDGWCSLSELTDVNGTLYFDNGSISWGHLAYSQLMRSDGTPSGTVPVTGFSSDSIALYGLTNVGGMLFFAAGSSTGDELWKSDGTVAGTVLVKDIRPGTSGSYPRLLTNVNGLLYFTADDGATGHELRKSDGTSAGTVLVKDINPGGGSAVPSIARFMTNVNSTLFFWANDGTTGRELWKSDGTAAGTVLVKDVNPGGGSAFSPTPGFMANVSGTLFFRANDGVHGPELWSTDGTAAGTVLVQDIRPGSGGSIPAYLTNVGGALYFSADDGVHGHELWVLPPPRVVFTFVNDLAAQRSYVFGLGVLFSTAVTLDPGAFEVRADTIDGPVRFALFSGTFEGGSWAYLVFPDFLADGDYTLTIHADLVHDALGRALDGDGDGSPGGDYLAAFHRLWGDLDGDRDVDDADLALFDEGLAAALWFLDMDGDGDADGDDRATLAGRVGTSL